MSQRERRASKVPNRDEFLNLDDFESLDDTLQSQVNDSQPSDVPDGGEGSSTGVPWTADEIMMMVEMVFERLNAIEGNFSCTITKQSRMKVWRDIWVCLSYFSAAKFVIRIFIAGQNLDLFQSRDIFSNPGN